MTTTDLDSADLETVHSGPPVSDEVAGSQPTGLTGSWARRVWFGAVVTAALALAFGPLPVYDYDRFGLNLHTVTPVRLWWVQATGVHDGRWDGLATAGFLALLAVFCALTVWALWYALQPDEAFAAPEGVAAMDASTELTVPENDELLPGDQAGREPVILTRRPS